MLVNFPEDSPRRSPSIAYTSSGPDSRVAATTRPQSTVVASPRREGLHAPGTRDVRLTAECARDARPVGMAEQPPAFRAIPWATAGSAGYRRPGAPHHPW